MINASNDNCQQVLIDDNTINLCNYSDKTKPVPAVTTYFMATSEIFINNDGSKPESAAIAAVIRYNNSPEAKALREANKAHGHTAQRNAEIDELRTGQGREYHNTTKRAAYAAVIEKTEGRSVRAYTKHETDEDRDTARKERDSIAKRERTANMTPAQKKEESRKRQIRRENAKKREQQALIDQA